MFIICALRFEIVDQTTRLLIPIIVLQNHNRYNILEKGHNYSINVEAIEAEVSSKLCFLMTYMLHIFLFLGLFLFKRVLWVSIRKLAMVRAIETG